MNLTKVLSGPIIWRIRRHRLSSSSSSAPTFTLKRLHPLAKASVQSFTCTHRRARHCINTMVICFAHNPTGEEEV